MIKVKCNFCGDELNEPGALLFSPPHIHNPGLVYKDHVCVECFLKMVTLMKPLPKLNDKADK
jgi:hypothetical protein